LSADRLTQSLPRAFYDLGQLAVNQPGIRGRVGFWRVRA